MHRMKPARIVVLSALSAVLLLSTSVEAMGAGARVSRRPHAATLTQNATPRCDPAPFDATAFSDPTTIDNSWLPLVPGTQFVLTGVANRGGGLLPHQIVTTVTDLTKVVNGVRTVVVLDQDITEGHLDESELAFEAQDDPGNVWNLGEYPEEFEGDVFLGAPSTWISGAAGAQAGVGMRADPTTTKSKYLQGIAPEIGFMDCGRVLQTGKDDCVPLGCFSNVLVIDEWSPLESGSGHQRKYYAPGVGNIRVGAVGDPEAETLVLTGLRQLSEAELEQVRSQVLLMDGRACSVAPVYCSTPPVEGSP